MSLRLVCLNTGIRDLIPPYTLLICEIWLRNMEEISYVRIITRG